jgi:nucleoside-diphosphate kinase
MVKPDAVAAGKVDAILAAIEEAGFKIVARRERQWGVADAAAFYPDHAQRDYFPEMSAFITSGV